jgi:dTDP-4-dehydrorhamnose reductase
LSLSKSKKKAMMKVAVIGANGQLGTDICLAFRANGDEVVELNHGTLEVSDPASVSSALTAARPNVVVNTAAFHHVEKCEADPMRAFAVNGVGARNLALVTRELGAVLTHISTDYVFDGRKRSPYEESDTPCPLNVYGNTKLAGEYFALTLNERSFVVRTSAIYGKSLCRAKGMNFVEKMLKLAKERDEIKVTDSEVVSPTPTADIASQIVRLSRCDQYGLLHATSEGSCSWYDFTREIFRLAGIKTKLIVAGPNEFPAKVPRPEYSVLENRRLKQLNLNVFEPWQVGLKKYLS